VESSERSAWGVRIAPMALLAVLAFASGLAVRQWSDESGESRAAAPSVAAPRDGDARSRIRLVRANPGPLRRPAARRRPAAATAAPIPTDTGAAPAPAPVAPEPSVPAPTQQPSPSTGSGQSFDLTGEEDSPEGTPFESDD